MPERSSYSREFKLEAVRMLERGDRSAAELAREPGVRRDQLYDNWGQTQVLIGSAVGKAPEVGCDRPYGGMGDLTPRARGCGKAGRSAHRAPPGSFNHGMRPATKSPSGLVPARQPGTPMVTWARGKT